MHLQVHHTSGISTCPVRKQHWFWIKGLYARNTSALVLECFYKSGSGVSLNSETHRKVWPKGYCVHINGPHLFSAFMQSALQCWLTFTHSCTHSHTNDGVNDAGRQPAGQELSGWGVSLSNTTTPCGYQPTLSTSWATADRIQPIEHAVVQMEQTKGRNERHLARQPL